MRSGDRTLDRKSILYDSWIFYETCTGHRLDVEGAKTSNCVEALDPARHIVGDRRNSVRHRVVDTLLGGPGLCPTVRRTALLEQQMGLRLDEKAKPLIASYSPALLTRAVNFLYTKEARSAFAIEGEVPSANRTERFVAALEAAPAFDTNNKAGLIRLQSQIVDQQFAATDWHDSRTSSAGPWAAIERNCTSSAHARECSGADGSVDGACRSPDRR